MRNAKDNLTGYVLREGDVPFSRRGINPVDAAIFTQLAYLAYEMIPEKVEPTLAGLAQTDLVPLVTRGIWMRALTDELLQALIKSERFRNVRWQNAVNTVDEDVELQFGAVTFELTPGEYFVAYRGTQATLLDWKEDFNMTFLDVLPSQKLAVRYLEHRIAEFPGQYFLGGHSKGGNLAVYALMNSNRATADAVHLVFNFDGPGLKTPLPVRVQAKVRKFIPESSIVGLLMEPENKYQVVQSRNFGVNQHNLLMWRVHRRHFATAPKLRWPARYTQRAIDAWIAEFTPHECQSVLDSMYTVLSNSDINDLNAVGQELPGTAKSVITQIRETDPAVKKQWRRMTNEFIVALRRAAKP